MIVKMIQDLGKTVEKMQEMFTKDLEELRDNQPQMNNTVGGINWITEAEELINDPEDRMVEITAIEQNMEKRMKRKWRQPERPLRQHWTHQHSHHRGPRRRRKRSWEITWRDNCWKLPQNGEGNSHSSPRNPESSKQDKPKAKYPKTHINQMNKDQTQGTNIKAVREIQQITHKGIPIRITADLSIETLQARREWQDIHKVMKENNLQPRLLYPARNSFRYEGKFKSITEKQKLREFSTTKPALQWMLKDLL